MRDDFHSQAWVNSHQDLSTSIHKLIRAAREAFDTLQAYQFDAPWRARPTKRKAGACRPAA